MVLTPIISIEGDGTLNLYVFTSVTHEERILEISNLETDEVMEVMPLWF